MTDKESVRQMYYIISLHGVYVPYVKSMLS